MKKILLALSLLVAIVSFSLVPATSTYAVSARPANCGSYSLENVANIAYGSTPAHVKVVIWKACDGGYYASAYSSPDSSGWKFVGDLQFGAYVNGVWQTTNTIYCGGPACDSPELYNVDTHGVMHGFYNTTDGRFYSCEYDYQCVLPYNIATLG